MAKPIQFDYSVFINCPFDSDYRPIVEAIIFTLQICRLEPRRADESFNTAHYRIEKILDIIGSCRYGIHDISRVQLSEGAYPRFNMPFEFGLDLACRKFGKSWHREKSLLVLDSDDNRYDTTLSDISGQDIKAHHNDPLRAIQCIRNWLVASPWTLTRKLPGAVRITEWYSQFQNDMEAIAGEFHYDTGELPFADFTNVVKVWLDRQSTSSI